MHVILSSIRYPVIWLYQYQCSAAVSIRESMQINFWRLVLTYMVTVDVCVALVSDDYVCQWLYVNAVRLSVCQFVFRLLVTSRKNYWTDFHAIFTTNVSVHKKVLNIWKPELGNHPPPDPDPGIFWRIVQHCKIWHFSTIWLISPERVIGFS